MNWLQSTAEDLEVAKHVIKKGYRVHGLFFCHLTVEKHLKAIFVERQSQHPPPIHDLPKIAEKAGLNLDDATMAQLSEMTAFNIRARYDERVFEFHRIAPKEYTKQWLDRKSVV